MTPPTTTLPLLSRATADAASSDDGMPTTELRSIRKDPGPICAVWREGVVQVTIRLEPGHPQVLWIPARPTTTARPCVSTAKSCREMFRNRSADAVTTAEQRIGVTVGLERGHADPREGEDASVGKDGHVLRPASVQQRHEPVAPAEGRVRGPGRGEPCDHPVAEERAYTDTGDAARHQRPAGARRDPEEVPPVEPSHLWERDPVIVEACVDPTPCEVSDEGGLASDHPVGMDQPTTTIRPSGCTNTSLPVERRTPGSSPRRRRRTSGPALPPAAMRARLRRRARPVRGRGR